MNAADDMDADDSENEDGFLGTPAEEGLSIEDLGRAYAELLQQGDDPYQAPQPRTELGEIQEIVDAETHLESGDPLEVSPRSILEAMLFVGTPDNRPLSNRFIASMMRGVSPEEIDDLVEELNEQYRAEVAPYEIVRQEEGYRLVLRESFRDIRDRFYGRIRQARLSQAAIDTLSIVAYRQPVTRETVDRIRGQSSAGVLQQLVKRRLIKIVAGQEGDRGKRFETTPRFLQLFQLNSLDDLPKSEDLDRWSG